MIYAVECDSNSKFIDIVRQRTNNNQRFMKRNTTMSKKDILETARFEFGNKCTNMLCVPRLLPVAIFHICEYSNRLLLYRRNI